MLLFSSIFDIKMATQKLTNLLSFFFITRGDMTIFTIQSKKIVSNEVKDN